MRAELCKFWDSQLVKLASCLDLDGSWVSVAFHEGIASHGLALVGPSSYSRAWARHFQLRRALQHCSLDNCLSEGQIMLLNSLADLYSLKECSSKWTGLPRLHGSLVDCLLLPMRWLSASRLDWVRSFRNAWFRVFLENSYCEKLVSKLRIVNCFQLIRNNRLAVKVPISSLPKPNLRSR